MTDTELVHQVEQAMLGAMITRPLRVGGLPGAVTPDLFTDERHQAIAAALTGTAGEERGLLGRLRGFFARFSRRTRENQAYLEALPGLCPDATHMDGYFQILAEARDQRDARARAAMTQAADAAQVLAGADGQLAVQTAGAGQRTAPGEMPASVARQARALAGYAQQFARTASVAPGQQGQPGQAAPAQPSQPAARRALAPQAADGRAVISARAGQTADGQARSDARAQQIRQQSAPAPFRQQAPRPAAGGTVQGAPDGGREPSPAAGTPAQITRAEAQDLLLAALMRDPGLAREIVSSLPATVFEDGPRRELYAMIGEFVAQRRPVDPLLVAWTADQRTSAGPDGAREGWLSPDYIRGIASLPPVPVHPTWLGQMLLGSDTGALTSADPERADSPAETATTTPEPRGETVRTTETGPGAVPDSSQAAGDRTAVSPAPRPARPAQAGQSGPPRGSRTETTPAPGLVEAPPPDPSQDGGPQRTW